MRKVQRKHLQQLYADKYTRTAFMYSSVQNAILWRFSSSTNFQNDSSTCVRPDTTDSRVELDCSP